VFVFCSLFAFSFSFVYILMPFYCVWLLDFILESALYPALSALSIKTPPPRRTRHHPQQRPLPFGAKQPKKPKGAAEKISSAAIAINDKRQLLVKRFRLPLCNDFGKINKTKPGSKQIQKLLTAIQVQLIN